MTDMPLHWWRKWQDGKAAAVGRREVRGQVIALEQLPAEASQEAT
jgi:hypothetical protein